MLKRTSQVGLVLLTLIIAISFLITGCNKTPSGGDSKLSNILIASWSGAYNVNTEVPDGEGSELELEMRKKYLADNNLWIEVVELSDWDNYFQIVNNLFMSGSKEYAIYALPAGTAMNLYKQGLLFPLSDSDYFPNYRTPIVGRRAQFQTLVEDLFTINGKKYGVMYGLPGASWQGNYIFFNKRLFQEAGLDPDLPFNMQRDGTWTWDNFLNICKQLTRDIDNDGIIDIYAFPSDDIRELMYGLVYSNNGNFVAFENGRYVNATNRPEFIEAMQFYQTLVNENVVKIRDYDVDEWGWNWSAFVDGRVAMVFDPEWRQGQLGDMVDDYGIVLAPKGPRASNYRTSLTEIAYCIPVSFSKEEVDVILQAFAAWYAPAIEEDWRQGYYWIYRDPRSVDETMVLQRQVAVYRDFEIVPNYPIGSTIESERWWEQGTPAQIVESWTPVIQAALDDANR